MYPTKEPAKRVVISSQHFDSSRVFISLEILTQCNFRCSYCYIYENPENQYLLAADDFKDSEVHQQNLKIIDALGNVKTPMHFFILGGEPTVYNELKDILNNIYALEDKYNIPKPIVEIVTNGKKFQDIKYTKRILNDFPDIRVTVSMHYEYMHELDYNKILNNINYTVNYTQDTSTLYILLPETIEEFLLIKDHLIETIDAIWHQGKSNIIISIVNGYNIRDKKEIIEYYLEYFKKINKSYLLESEFINFKDADGPLNIGRFDFLLLNAEARVNYRFCNYNAYIIDKDGQASGTNCSIVKEDLDILTASSEEINDFLTVRPLICTEIQCPINCTCMPKRTTYIDFPKKAYIDFPKKAYIDFPKKAET